MGLKEIREAQGITQRELAERAGVSRRMVEYYEQGAKDIKKAAAETVIKLADALGADVHEIIK